MANLLDNTAFVPSEPASTSYSPLPSPPFDAGGFLNGLSGAIFGMSPQQAGQGFSDLGQGFSNFGSGVQSFGSGVQSDLSSFGQSLQQRGPLGSTLGETVFPGAFEGFQAAAKPFETGGAFGGSFEDDATQVGRGLSNVLQGVAGATDPSTNPVAQQLASGRGLPAVGLSLVHGLATYGQGASNLMINSPKFENELGDSFKLGLKSTVEPGASWSNEDGDRAIQQLLSTGSQIQNTLFDPQLMHQTLYSGFKTNGADDVTAKNAADSLAEPLNFVAQLLTGGEGRVGMKVAQSMLAQYVASWATAPAKTLDSTKQAGGDFFDLLGTAANMSRGGPAPSPDTISKGLTGLAQALGGVFFGLHAGSAAAGLAGRASFRAAAAVDKPAANSQALTELHDRLQNYGTEDIQQTPQTSEAGVFGQAGQTPQISAARAAETAGRTSEDSGSIVTPAEQANEGLQGENLSGANPQSVSSLGPPVAQGFTRLYRVETKPDLRIEHPDWIRQGQDELGITAAKDRWFTSDPSHLDFYKEDHPDFDNKGRVAYIDVPSGDLERYRASNLPEGRYSAQGMSEHEFFVPPELSRQRRDIAQDTPALAFTGEHADGVPEPVKTDVANTLKSIDPGGWVNEVSFMEHGPGRNYLGSWDPQYNARSVNLDMRNISEHEVGDQINSLRDKLDDATAAFGDNPRYSRALSAANKILADVATSLTPTNMVQWIAAHETLHASLARIYDYPPNGAVYDPVESTVASHLGEGLQMIRHMDSTPEGKAWLDHLSAKMGLAGEVQQLRTFAARAGDTSVEHLYRNLQRFDQFPVALQKRIATAKTRVNEALVHAILNAKDLSPYPYYKSSGDKAHAKSFFNPQDTQENARLAGSYFERYSQRAPAESASPAGRTPAGFRLQRGSSDRGDDATLADQTRLEEARSNWHDELSAAQQRLHDIQSGKRLGNSSLVSQLQTTVNLMAHRLDLFQKGGLTVDEIKTEADRLAKTGSPPSTQELPPQRLTPETAQAALQDLRTQREQAPPAVPAAKPARVTRQQQLLQEVNSIQPAPQHYSDPRLSEEHRDALAKFAMDQMAKGQKLADAAKARGDMDGYLQHSLQQLATSATWKTFFAKRATPDDFVVGSAPKVLNYEAEAARIADLKAPDHFLSPLKGLAGQVTASLANLNRSIEAGLPEMQLQSLRTAMQFQMAKFRSAYDLYNSPVFKLDIDKQSYDWKGTRGIARRIDALTADPRDKALMAARLLGEQLKKPYTLQDAARAIRDTSLGISKEAKNWHPDFKKILAGEMWHTVKQVYDNDPRIPLGVDNIPAHELVTHEDFQTLHDSQLQLRQQYDDARKKTQMEINLAKIRERRGQLPKGTTSKLIKDQRQKNLDFSNERARLAALIDNHPESARSRLVNAPPPTAADLQPTEPVLANPDPNLPNSHLINQAQGLNARISDPSPDGFSLESFLGEGRNGPITQAKPLPPWFSPRWGEVLTNLREMGGEHKLLADLTQDLMLKMGDHLDPSRNMWHPKQWFKAHWEAVSGIPQRVAQIETRLNNIINNSKDPNFSRGILEAIDDTNDVAQRRAAGQLTTEQANIANFLNEYWRSTRQLFSDPALGDKALIAHFVENYVPHIVLKDPAGNPLYDARRARWSSRAFAAKQRMADGVTHEPIYRTIQSLENQGYTMETNLAKIFSGHANSTFRMMKITEMKNTLGGLIYNSPDGKFTGFPIVSTDDLAAMRRTGDPAYKGLDIFDDPKAKVRWGPGDNMFQGYRVHPELAREIEKLASMKDLPGSGPARFFRSAGGLFKFFEFAINPRHAFNVFSNIANLHSPVGLASPRVWSNVYGRANRALLPEQQGSFFRNISGRNDASRVQGLLNEKAKIEQEMHAITRKMQAAGDDPLDPMPSALTVQQADLRDQFNEQREALIDRHRQLDVALGTRDRDLLANLMQKGLVPDKELMEGADLNGLSEVTEHIPLLSQFHRWMWRDVVWRGQVGIAMHLADQFMMKTARDYGWDGNGGAAVAEKFLTPELQDRVQRKAVDYAKQGTAMLNKLDMTAGWQLYGRATLLSAPWTLGQLQATRDMLGNNPATKLLGREDMTTVSDDMLNAGFGKKEAKVLDDMHTKLARRMIIAGTAKLAMTSFAMQALGTWIYTGQPGNPISNFLRDPDHTFDVYQGKNLATGTDMWMDNPFFGFQHEMVNYALAGVKAAMKGEDPWKVGVAPFAKFVNKNNPVIRQMFDVALGIETSRWLAGLPPGMGDDTDLQNLHRALDTLGVPDFGGTEDRVLYVLRNLPRPPFLGTGTFPSTAVKRGPDLQPILDEKGHQIPLTDPKSLLNDFGVGGVVNIGADAGLGPLVKAAADSSTSGPSQVLSDLGQLPGSVANADFGKVLSDVPPTLISSFGTSEVAGSKPLYDTTFSGSGISVQQDPQGYFPAQAKREVGQQEHAKTVQQEETLVQIGNLAASGQEDSYQKIADLRDQYGLTDRQVTDAVMHGAYANVDGTSLRSKGLGGSSLRAGIVTINGQQLTEDESLQYNKTLNNRQLYALQQLQKDPEFNAADGSTKTMLMTEFMNVASKFTTTQASQQLLGSGGKALSDDEYKQVIQDVVDSRRSVQGALMLTPEYQGASQSQQRQMYQSYLSMATTLAWNMRYGDLKDLDGSQLQQLVTSSVFTETQTLDYLHNTPFYQGVTPAEQQTMDKEYSNLSRQMTMNMYNGKGPHIQSFAMPTYMQATVNTEETAKYLLHQADFYQLGSLKEQQSLDAKYTTIARSLATKDWSNGKPILTLDQAGQSFAVGPEQVVVGHLMAEQGFNDLQTQFGGSQLLTAYAQQETQIRKDIKENVVAPPATLSRMQTIAVAAFERANPQYSAFKKARTNWERGTSIGRLYTALNADEQGLATVDTAMMTDPASITDDLNQSLDTGTANYGATPEELAVGLGN